MHPILSLFRKDFAIFFRHRSGVVLTFLVPVILIALFGFVFGLYQRKDPGPSGIPLVVVNQCQDPAAELLIEALRGEKTFKVITVDSNAQGGPKPVTEDVARAWMRDNYQRFTLVLPPDFISTEQVGLHMRFLNNPRNEIETMTVKGMLQKTVFMNAKDLLSKSLMGNARRMVGKEKFEAYNRRMADTIADTFGGNREDIYQRFDKGDYWGIGDTAPGATPRSEAAADPSLRRLDTVASTTPVEPGKLAEASEAKPVDKKEDAAADLMAKMFRFEDEQVMGKQVKNPNAARLTGGYAIMFLLFAVSGFATSFFGEKSGGIFQRVLSTRARRHHILMGKFLFCVVLGLMQLGFLFVAGEFLFGLQLAEHLLPLTCVAVAASAACAAFGMLIASVTNNAQAANGLATLLVLTMSTVGGAWFPVSLMPELIQRFSKFTVVYWAVEGFTNVLWADYGVLQSLPYIGVLLLMTAACQAIAVWRFRRGDMFS